ncbi:MAG: hypothetical protein GXP14_05150 [Gammaproteobacteria bacterium]|nr:hypothetical protein [Gammaproteobacteria bacterium]
MILIKAMETGQNTMQNRARIDALVWLHYGINHPVLNRDNLQWLVTTQFPTLLKHHPDYPQFVMQAYDQYQKLTPNIQHNVFALKSETAKTTAPIRKAS